MDRIFKIYNENIKAFVDKDIITNDRTKINCINPKKRKNEYNHYPVKKPQFQKI